jgi:hypothetical protein
MKSCTRAELMKKLANASMWAAATATWVLAIIWPGWTFVAGACTIALTVLNLVVRLADADALPFGRRWGRRPQGGGLSGRGRDDDDGLPARQRTGGARWSRCRG